MLKGTNIAGGDVAYTKWQPHGSPKPDDDYMFVKAKDIDYLVAAGATVFRLLFSWEAMQPTALAAIPGPGDFGVYFTQFKALVDYATAKGVTVIIDIHNAIDSDFAAYYGAKIGTGTITPAFANLWGQLATIFKGNTRVWFGLMNEPSNMPTLAWFSAAQAAILTIRVTGATNKIVCPGAGFTAASTWTGSLWTDTGTTPHSNAYGWLNANGVGKPLVDPGNNLAIQVHLYADAGAGGGATDVVSKTILSERLKVTVDWARANHVQVFVAEVGLAAASVNAPEAWADFLKYCDANADTVIGWTFWAYGPPAWWGGYKFTMCPSSDYLTDSAQMKMVKPSWVVPVAPPVVDPTVAALQAQVVNLMGQVTALTTQNGVMSAQVMSLQSSLNAAMAQLVTTQNALAIETNDAHAAQAKIDAAKAALGP